MTWSRCFMYEAAKNDAMIRMLKYGNDFILTFP